jgi:thymidylate synthase
MKNYHDLLKLVLAQGDNRIDRTKVGTKSIFGHTLRFDLSKGFPLITTKKLHTKSIIHELIWFLSGSTNINYLKKHNVKIWDAWADENGDLGPVYGKQWRNWQSNELSVDQIKKAIELIKNDPTSRRIIVNAWNVSDLDKMALMPCHALFQFYVVNGKLSCQLYQRSADLFLGLPFNIASYSILTHMMARETGLLPGDFIWVGGDCHIYNNHITQVETQLSREEFPLPNFKIVGNPKDIFSYSIDNFEIENYQHHPAIKAPIAV